MQTPDDRPWRTGKKKEDCSEGMVQECATHLQHVQYKLLRVSGTALRCDLKHSQLRNIYKVGVTIFIICHKLGAQFAEASA